MMSSVDGRLLTERWTEPFDNEKEQMYEPYFSERGTLGGQASIIGRNTVQKDFTVEIFDYQDYSPAKEFNTFVQKGNWEHSYIIFDSKGKLLYENNTLEGSGIIAVLGETVSDEYLSLLRDRGVSYLFAGQDGNDIAKALETLGNEFGYTTLLLEGGGTLNGSFLNLNLIDELSLMIYPGIDGFAGMPAIIDYKGDNDLPAKGQSLELLSVEKLANGIIWLRYKFHKTD